MEILGKIILDQAKIINGGILVFFGSYYFLEQCRKAWVSLEKEFKEYKKIFFDTPRDKKYINNYNTTSKEDDSFQKNCVENPI